MKINDVLQASNFATTAPAAIYQASKNTSISESLKETIVAANITSTDNGNINISSGADTSILASNLKTTNGGDINITVGQLTDGSGVIVTNDDAKVTIAGASNKETSYNKDENFNYSMSIDYDGISYANYQKDTNQDILLTNVSSNLDSANNININAKSDLSLKGSILNSGQADIEGTNNLISGSTTITSKNLDILAAVNSEISSYKQRTGTTFTNRNNISGSVSNNYINSQLNAKSDNFTFNVSEGVNIEGEDILTGDSGYISALDSQLSSDLITRKNLLSDYLYYEDTTREMTEAGQAVVAIGAVAATIVTAGAAGLAIVGSAAAATASTTAIVVTSAGVAAASTAASTAATTAVSASMNMDGDIFKQAKDISKTTWDATTSREAFESYVIAAGTAALTAGLAQGLEGVVQSSAEAVNAGNATITQRAISTLSQNNLATALADSAVSHVSSTAVQSSINGDSFSDALESQGSNILIGAVGNLGAKEIGSAFKSGNISRAKQLTLHSALGCGTALAGGGDCASGALSGVSGELAGEYVKDNLYPGQTTSSLTGQQKTVIKELGGLAGGLSAIFTGNAVGLSESDIADNIFSGQRIGKNAVENNLLYAAARDLATRNRKKELVGSNLPGTHQFSILAPDNPEDFTPELLSEIGAPPMQDLGDGTMGWVVGAHKRLDESRSYNLLLGEFNEASDFIATQEFMNPSKYTSWNRRDFDTEAHQVSHPGLTDTQLITNVLQNTVNYQNNMVSIPYPKPIPTISDSTIINSNSWNQSILQYSGATGYPNNFKGADVGSQNLLTKQYFEEKNE